MTTMPIYQMVDTWNAGGTTFTAIGMNVTDTASAAGSLLMDLQVGGTTRFSVQKDGTIRLGNVLLGSWYGDPNIASIQTLSGTNSLGIRPQIDFVIAGNMAYSWTSNNDLTGPVDALLRRDAAGTIAQRDGVNAQAFRIYNTFTDASNFERIELVNSGTFGSIGWSHAGTGAARNFIVKGNQLVLQSGASYTNRWILDTNGHFLAATDNTFDIGASGANRPRDVFVARDVLCGRNMLMGTTGQFSAAGGATLSSPADGVWRMQNNANTDFNRLQFGGTTSSFPALKRNGTAINVRLADDSADAPFTSGRATINTMTVGLGGQTAVATNTALGFEALNSASLTGVENTGVGYRALQNTTTGNYNSAVGLYALLSNTTGTYSSAVGVSALQNSTTGSYNSAVGVSALAGNTTGGDNSALGYAALLSNTTGANNSAVGVNALYSNTTGGSNSAVGRDALLYNTTGGSNSALGRDALRFNTTGGSNSALGAYALRFNTTGSTNSALGREALYANTTGGDNSALGYAALLSNTTGGSNSALGRDALFSNTTGGNNVGVGEQAGDVITTGARNTIVGTNSDPSANNGNDQTVIGEGLTGKGDDTFFCGGTNGAYNEKNVTTWETTSDARIKKDIADFADGLEVLEQVRVRSFRYRTPEEITDLPASAAINQPGVQLGVIAQELQAVLPECVTENSTGVLSVNTDPLVWYLINAVQQLSAEVKALKGE